MLSKINKTYLYLFTGSFVIRLIVLVLLSFWISNSGLFTEFQQSVFPALNGDSEGYYQISLNLSEYGEFSSDAEAPYEPNTFRTPLYPAFLSFIFTLGLGKLGAILIQIVLASLISVLIYALAHKFFSHKVSLLAGILFAIEPYSIFISDIFLTEILFTLFLTLSVYLLTQRFDFKKDTIFIGLAGITLGLATLTRPVSMFLIPLGTAFIALMLWRRYRFKALIIALIFLTTSIFTVLPWASRNHDIGGSYTLASNSWNNALFWNVSMHKSFETGESLDDVVKEYTDQINSDATVSELKSFKYIEEEKRLAIEYLKENKFSYAKFHSVKTIPFFLSDGLREIASFLRITPKNSLPNFTDTLLSGNIKELVKQTLQGGWFTLLFFFGVLLWSAITILTTVGIIKGLRNKKEEIVWFTLISACLILYFAVISTPLSPGRMRFVVEPLTFIFVAYGAATVFSYAKTYSSRHKKISTTNETFRS